MEEQNVFLNDYQQKAKRREVADLVEILHKAS